MLAKFGIVDGSKPPASRDCFERALAILFEASLDVRKDGAAALASPARALSRPAPRLKTQPVARKEEAKVSISPDGPRKPLLP